MACKPCEAKKAAAAAKEIPLEDCNKWFIQCFCGLIRTIPRTLNKGDEFSLVACPKCGIPFHGRFHGDQVEHLT